MSDLKAGDVVLTSRSFTRPVVGVVECPNDSIGGYIFVTTKFFLKHIFMVGDVWVREGLWAAKNETETIHVHTYGDGK